MKQKWSLNLRYYMHLVHIVILKIKPCDSEFTFEAARAEKQRATASHHLQDSIFLHQGSGEKWSRSASSPFYTCAHKACRHAILFTDCTNSLINFVLFKECALHNFLPSFSVNVDVWVRSTCLTCWSFHPFHISTEKYCTLFIQAYANALNLVSRVLKFSILCKTWRN